eukprot:gb/GEZN01008264.1/.p1 GENE.gb/GEZN01008264.1/~~gb/GEZN01008264.1/.p1  ORF type:complete len:433 (+),score=61.77 gb/GEZN01008264.1/:23-1321(+)
MSKRNPLEEWRRGDSAVKHAITRKVLSAVLSPPSKKRERCKAQVHWSEEADEIHEFAGPRGSPSKKRRLKKRKYAATQELPLQEGDSDTLRNCTEKLLSRSWFVASTTTMMIKELGGLLVAPFTLLSRVASLEQQLSALQHQMQAYEEGRATLQPQPGPLVLASSFTPVPHGALHTRTVPVAPPLTISVIPAAPPLPPPAPPLPPTNTEQVVKFSFKRAPPKEPAAQGQNDAPSISLEDIVNVKLRKTPHKNQTGRRDSASSSPVVTVDQLTTVQLRKSTRNTKVKTPVKSTSSGLDFKEMAALKLRRNETIQRSPGGTPNKVKFKSHKKENTNLAPNEMMNNLRKRLISSPRGALALQKVTAFKAEESLEPAFSPSMNQRDENGLMVPSPVSKMFLVNTPPSRTKTLRVNFGGHNLENRPWRRSSRIYNVR